MPVPREFERKRLRKYQRPGGPGIPVTFTKLFKPAAKRGPRQPEVLWNRTGFSREFWALTAAGFVEGHGLKPCRKRHKKNHGL